jgi:hypothetical protein
MANVIAPFRDTRQKSSESHGYPIVSNSHPVIRAIIHHLDKLKKPAIQTASALRCASVISTPCWRCDRLIGVLFSGANGRLMM